MYVIRESQPTKIPYIAPCLTLLQRVGCSSLSYLNAINITTISFGIISRWTIYQDDFYRFCSNLLPLNERTVRSELNTSWTMCPAFEYVFNSFTVSLAVNCDKINTSSVDGDNSTYLWKYEWSSKNHNWNTKHDQSQFPVEN